ncbi:tyrosine-type recombinase/integrase [Glutamicibacter creatinolyticus]|uniref:tyrosine-type recombinase/integrase n=1 Tax=Glutamicibacter creatinolyticus TaxID=162496 RepID=UPI0031DFFBA8
MVARIEDRWFTKKRGPDKKPIRKATHGVGLRWMAIWDDLDGKERTKKFPTKDQAQAHLDDITTKKGTGSYINTDAGNTLIRDLLPQWSEASVHWRASTRESAESQINAHLKPYWGDWAVGAVRKRDVQDWVRTLNMAPRSVSTVHGRLVTFMGWCIEQELLTKNPAIGVNLPKGFPREHIFLSVDQVTALANATHEHYRTLIWFLATTGLRIGEASELRVKDLRLEYGRIRVERSVMFKNGGQPVVGPPKSGKARTVSILPGMASTLQGLARGRAAEDLVFTSVTGAQIRRDNFKKRYFDTAVTTVNEAAAAELRKGNRSALTLPKNIWVHDLRHTAASWLVRSGASVKAVQRMLGHATASITLDVYAGLFDQDLDDVVERMASIVPALGEAA